MYTYTILYNFNSLTYQKEEVERISQFKLLLHTPIINKFKFKFEFEFKQKNFTISNSMSSSFPLIP